LRHPADFVGDRRRFLEVIGASLALATGGCFAQPKETIVPSVRSPEYEVPGRPRYFATAITLGGIATGVLVESHQGRPTKIEGNPDHPASLGAVDAITQSAVLSLYDPDRSQAIMHRGTIRSWAALSRTVDELLVKLRPRAGAGIRILTETVTSPTMAAQLGRLLEALPEARWHQYEPINGDQALEATRLAWGRPLQSRWRIDQADVILAFDCDFLASGPGHLRYARDFMSRRQPEALDAPSDKPMNRLYVVEPMPTPTGVTADHRLAMPPSVIHMAVLNLAERLGVAVLETTPAREQPPNVQNWLDVYVRELTSRQLTADERAWLEVASRDLLAHGKTSLVVAGPLLPPQTQALVARINSTLGNHGTTLEYTEPVVSRPENQFASLSNLVNDIEAGAVELLVILEGNPVFTAPPQLRLAERIRKVPLSVHLSLYQDETSACCQWHVPAAHPLELWGDARAYDGTVSIIQPLIAPLYGGKTPHELVALLAGEKDRSAHDLVRSHWRQQHGDEGFDAFWHQALQKGVVEGTALPAVSVSSPSNEARNRLAVSEQRPTPGSGQLEIAIRPDPTIYDGRFANNGWLQELPKPITKLTWRNAALLSPRTSQELGVANEDVVEIAEGDRRLALPAWIVPGHADGCVSIHAGHGRTRGGRLCNGTGSNAFVLQDSANAWMIRGATIRKTGGRQPLASTQRHHQITAERGLVREATFDQYRNRSEQPSAERHDHAGLTMYDPRAPSGDDPNAWGMSINLTTCVACNACVIACQAENNIPVVGEEQVLREREMHWIRVDTYFAGSDEVPRIHHQPLPCMHCEAAPCEVVCPVAATVHSAEGLNEMVYNRCVGTRYCSNNCPYKVRRFNYLDFQPPPSPVLELLPNPDVTVRSRGVMEKCTYCVQRINAARIEAKREGREIRDGDVVTACQAVCPTQAIVFGNINDPNSRVAQRKSLPLDYGLLAELNTRPRTTYLARLRNTNEELAHG
jgi:molybdopterin-containing oxidoreductase family iron-sulfur binding subunit